MQEVNDCFNKIKKDCFKFISSQETKKDKFKNKDDWSKYLKDKIKTHIGITFMEKNITQKFHEKNGKIVSIIFCWLICFGTGN